MGAPINLEIHHIDGDRENNSTDNLALLCPNCHSYTDNYCGKNKKSSKSIPEAKEMLQAYQSEGTIASALRKLGLALTGTNYRKMHRVIDNM